MLQIGAIVGEKYRLLRLIGQGGMGAVYEAEHLELGKRVAIKMPRDEVLDDRSSMARFEREPRVMASTGHRGVVEVHDVGLTESGHPFVVMELLEGRSLSALLAAEPRLDLRRALHVVAQVLSVLEAAHRKGIVHRDVKPRNIFLLGSGHGLPEVKLLDFGTSKLIGRGCLDEKLTETGALLGTPYYMAPEQFSDAAAADHRCDLYAVGVVLYEALTGALPFTGTNVCTLFERLLRTEPRPPRELCPELPRPVEELILRALAREPGGRFASAQSMLRAVLPFLDAAARDRLWLPEALRDGPAPSPLERPAATEAAVAEAGPPTELPAAAPLEPVAAAEAGRGGKGERPGRGPALSLAVVLLAIPAVVVAVMVSWPERSAGPETAAPTVARPASASPESGPSAADRALPVATAEPEGEVTLVTLRIVGAPPEGELLLDGARLARGVVTLPRSKLARTLTLEVAGREVYASLVDFEADRTIDLTRLLEPPPTPPRAPRARAGSSSGGRGLSSVASEAPEASPPAAEVDPAPARLGFASEWER